MSVRQTRRLLVLWGQTLGGYVPPHSPSGLVRGHLLHRYSVSGAVDSVSPPLKTDEEIAAYVSCGEWLPTRTPAELVLNANEYSTFHAIATVAPEDVRWCTRYLLSTSGASADRVTRSSATVPHNNSTAPSVTMGLLSSYSSPQQRPVRMERVASAAVDPITGTLGALLHVLHEYRCLLAGAEALQTGVPISCVLGELMEAEMYLTWSLRSHRATALSHGVPCTPCPLGGLEDNMDVPIKVGERVMPLTGAESRIAPEKMGSEDAETAPIIRGTLEPGKMRMGREEHHRQMTVLHHRFTREVVHLHGFGPQGPYTETCQGRMLTSAEGYENTTASLLAKPRVPLVVAVTSTARSLAAALKSAAVAWTLVDYTASDGSGGSGVFVSRRRVYAEDVLWRPAPASALVATWWAALLHRQQRSSERASAAEGAQASLLSAPAFRGLGGPDTFSSPVAFPTSPKPEKRNPCDTSAQYDRQSIMAASMLSCNMCRFHVLITGGDTADHFLLPLLAGLQESAFSRRSAFTDESACTDVGTPNSKGIIITGSFWSQGFDNGCLLPAVQSAEYGQYEVLSMVLCYGCPAGQVAYLRAVRDSYLASHHLTTAPEAMKSESHSTKPAYAEVTAGRQGARPLFAHGDYLTSMNKVDGAVTDVAELHTEAPTVSMLAAYPHGESAPASLACGSSRAFLLSYHLPTFSARVPELFPSGAEQEVESTTEAAPPTTIEEVAARVFESSLLEQPLRHREIRHAAPSVCWETSPKSHHPQETVLASAGPQGDVTVQMGWCSLCFAPQQHTPSFLRTLTQRHWGQPLRSGHSMDPMCRRGPAPSSLHIQLAQEALCCSTRGGCTHVLSTMNGGEHSEAACLGMSHFHDEAFVAPKPIASSGCKLAVESGAPSASGRRSEVLWKHVCGGFTLPLTAVVGRGSPYLVPCLLLSDLTEVLSLILAERRQGRVSEAAAVGEKQSLSREVSGPQGRYLDLAQEWPNRGLGVRPQAGIQLPAGAEGRITHAHVACAVAAVIESVSQLKRVHDTEAVGFRGVVAGNFLFVCCYPDAWQEAVRKALTRP